MELIDLLIDKRKRSAGYGFSENKGDFMSGARIGIVLTRNYYINQIEEMQQQIKQLQQQCDYHKKDLVTISEIILKHQP